MRRGVRTALVLLAFGSVVMPALPAAAGYGAIAWDKESGKSGWIFNQPTAKKAAEMAVSQCGASGCRVIIRTDPKRCAAIATIHDGKAAGAAARSTEEAARLAAMTDCQKRKAGDCIVRASDCNK
jgi:Domain of unknown function (DUF4189)